MPDDVVSFVSLVLIMAVLAVSHPVRPEALAAFSERVAATWTDLGQTGACDPEAPMYCVSPEAVP